MSAERSNPGEVVVALECRASPGFVSVAIAVARSLAASLDAIVIEDARLLAAAALPFTRELVPGRRELAPFEPEALERALRLEGERLRRLVRTEAEAAGIAWTLRIERTRRDEIVARHAVVLLGDGEHAPALPSFLRRSSAAQRVALVVDAAHGVRGAAARVAARIARNANMSLQVVMVGADRKMLDAARALIDAVLADEASAASFNYARVDLPRALGELRPTLVVVGRDGSSDLVDELREIAACPVLVVKEADRA